MTARNDTLALLHQIRVRCGRELEFDDVNTLRRAQIALHRWAELECGDSNDYCSRVLVRGYRLARDMQKPLSDKNPNFAHDETGKAPPYMEIHAHDKLQPTYTRIPDREAGALRRVRHICAYYKLGFYHQTDPRGCALYISNEPLSDSNYTRGVACCE